MTILGGTCVPFALSTAKKYVVKVALSHPLFSKIFGQLESPSVALKTYYDERHIVDDTDEVAL